MTWQRAIETTVRGLGYELVDAEKSAGGLLRVFIDHPSIEADGDEQSDGESALTVLSSASRPAGALASPPAATEQSARFITVDDCERVTRQLQHVLEVEGCDYARLEVSSPGLDRPLKKAADYRRFVGEQVELTLKLPFQGRKKYRGLLLAHGDGWRLELPEGGGADAAQKALDFELSEVREARLDPVVDSKGRRFGASAETEGGASAPTAPGGSRDLRAGKPRPAAKAKRQGPTAGQAEKPSAATRNDEQAQARQARDRNESTPAGDAAGTTQAPGRAESTRSGNRAEAENKVDGGRIQ